MENFYMCYVDGEGTPSYKHPNMDKASVEAERLARLPNNIGKAVAVLGILRVCKAKPPQPPIEWYL